MDLSKILLEGSGDSNGDDDKGTSPGEGIYSITAHSYNGTFIKCFTIEVDRSPTSTYPTPPGYKMISTATSISMGGVHIVEHFVPQLLLDIDIQILLTTTDLNPSSDSASGIKFKSFTPTERKELYQNIGDPQETFKKLLEKVEVKPTGLSFNVQSTKCLKQLTFGFGTTGIQEIDGLLSKRITPATFMQIVYSGFGIILHQQEVDKWELTDLMTLVNESQPQEVSLENIASLRTSYDYKKMAKSTIVAWTADGRIAGGNIASGDVRDVILKKSYDSPADSKDVSYGKFSVATGADAELSAPSIPLLKFAVLKDIKITPASEDKSATGTWTPQGDSSCFGGQEITEPVTEVNKSKSSFMFLPAESKEKKYDVSAIGVKMKGLFAKHLHKMMIFRNKLESAQLSITLEGVALTSFTKFKLGDAQGSLQKVVITPTEARKVNESANVEVEGFIMNSTTIRSSGRTITVISYVNMEDTFPLVFGKR